MPANTVDVVISNCVINLSVDEPAGVSDVVAEDTLTPEESAERGSYVGCVAGALSMSEYRDGRTAAGFTDVVITPTHEVGDGMHSAIVHAVKPTTATSPIADTAGTCC